MTPDEFRTWMVRLGIDKHQAAAALGVKIRQIERYLSGWTPPKRATVLACEMIELRMSERRPSSNSWSFRSNSRVIRCLAG